MKSLFLREVYDLLKLLLAIPYQNKDFHTNISSYIQIIACLFVQ